MAVDRTSKHLASRGIKSEVMHGDIRQSRRNRVLEEFKTGKVKLLIASDLAARGIDVDGITHVVNYDIPSHGKEYVHRVGRTARAGRAGRAVAFVTQYDVELYQRLEHLLGRRLPKADVDEDRALAFLDRVTEASRSAQRQMNDDDSFKKRRKKRDDYDDDDDAVDEKPRHKFAGLKKKKHASSKKRRR